MRLLIGFLLLACVFAIAALWHQRTLAELRAEREQAALLASGTMVQTASGVLPEGWGVVVVGRPSGAAPLRDAAGSPAPAAITVDPARASLSRAEARAEVPKPATAPLGDFEMKVQAGQTLSGIAHAHYGHAPSELVQRLAKYNGLADANALTAGQSLRLPPLEKLGEKPGDKSGSAPKR
jgi:nucleoid-associated protein YgaU